MTEVVDTLECRVANTVLKSYEGEYDEQKRRFHGPGSAVLDNESSYSGSYKNGLFDGKGTFVWADKVEYKGDFVRGHMDGSGEYVWPDGSKYTGDIVCGKRHGHGIFECSTGQYYDGSWYNGKRHGSGTMYYDKARTVFYVGGWVENKREGFGTMTYASGNIYEGEWVNDKKHGQGVMTWQDRGEVYLGAWDNDLPHGVGEQIWADTPGKSFQRQMCNIYRGEWKEGMRFGRGCFFYANGSQYEGEWENNMKNGYGTFVHSDGRIHFGEFNCDRMLSSPPGCNELSNTNSASMPRETESVNAQYRLHINDVLASYPVTGNKTNHKIQTQDIERLILRYNAAVRSFLKRFTNAAGTYRSIQHSNKPSKRDTHPILHPPKDWTPMELLFHSRRCILDKFFCITLQQLCQFARECELIGPLLTGYDVCMCVKAMHNEHSKVAHEMEKAYRRQELINALPPPPIITQTAEEDENEDSSHQDRTSRTSFNSHSARSRTSSRSNQRSAGSHRNRDNSEAGSVQGNDVAGTLSNGAEEVKSRLPRKSVDNPDSYSNTGGVMMDASGEGSPALHAERTIPEINIAFKRLDMALNTTFEKDIYQDFLLPIREREFVELVVRIISEAMCRRHGGVSGAGLFDIVYRTMAETIEPLASEIRPPPVFVAALYSDKVQMVLRKYASSMRSLWDQVIDIANEGFPGSTTPSPQVKHVVKLALALRGSTIQEDDVGVIQIMEAINKKSPGSDDISSLDLFVTFDDFTEMFCRLVVSDLWIYSSDDDNHSVDAQSQRDELESVMSGPGIKRSSTRPTTSAGIIESGLAKRLSEWLKLV